MYSLPSLISIIKHYSEISEKGGFTSEDVEKAKLLLQSLKWRNWDDIE